MAAGNNSSFRWQPDRTLSDAERANFWQLKFNEMRLQRDDLDAKCQRLAMKIAEYDRLFAFKTAEEKNDA